MWVLVLNTQTMVAVHKKQSIFLKFNIAISTNCNYFLRVSLVPIASLGVKAPQEIGQWSDVTNLGPSFDKRFLIYLNL
jgi:hypothetical protein